MVDKKTTAQTRKRVAKAIQDDFWDCSVCTFRNSPEAFKCLVCDVRKGTSTRKPRLNQQIVAQQEATRLVTMAQMPTTSPPLAKKSKDELEKSPEPSEFRKRKRMKKARCHIRGIDRSSCDTYKITVNDNTVVITEFKTKK